MRVSSGSAAVRRPLAGGTIFFHMATSQERSMMCSILCCVHDVSAVLFVDSGARCNAISLRFVESMLDSHARCACMPMSSCCCPHAVVLMFAGRCAGQLPASQTFSMCIQPDSQLHLDSPPRTFSSVQFSSVIGYWLSVIGYRLSVISPHVVVRMPFELDPCF